MKGKPLYKKKGQTIAGVKLDTSKLIVVTDTQQGRVFYQTLDEEPKKSTMSQTSFRQQYELCGFVD